MLVFKKDFTQQEPIPEKGIEKALEVLRSGRLHRYNLLSGEKGLVCELEEKFAVFMGMKYCLACASCGSSLFLALKSVGVNPGDKVLCNAYTLAPVPGAIEHCGAQTVLVDILDDYTIDTDDLAAKAESSGARFLMLSHMRGHIARMDKVMEVCERYNLVLIEDCAHTMGATWDGKKSGTFGKVGCYSTQTYKHMNSGEGGLLVTNDDEVMARAIIHSGSYMIYGTHTSRPAMEAFEKVKWVTPNFSMRMDHLRAALLLPQLEKLDVQCRRWNELYDHTEALLRQITGISCPLRDSREYYVGSSIQFNIDGTSVDFIRAFLEKTAERGVQIKWFGSDVPVGFTSSYDSWRYIPDLPDLPNTKKVLATMCDMRLPLTFTTEDCELIVAIIREVLEELRK